MHFLIVEDNPDHLELILDMLEESYRGKATLKSFPLIKPALEYLATNTVDIFLCDLNLPDSPINNTVAQIKALSDAPPIIVLTSLNDNQLAQGLVKEGIQDFLPKSDLSPSQLLRACNYAVERKKLTQSIVEKNEDYRAFCYSLTHDFKSSLWQIARFAQIFKHEAESQLPDTSELPLVFLDKICNKVETVNKLVTDLQDYLSLDVAPQRFSRMSLTTAAKSAADMLGELVDYRNAEIHISQLPEVHGNMSQMQLLFTNLITNGIKYNDSDRPAISISAVLEGNQKHHIRIEDNGIGIPEDKLDQIFTPFERLHSQDQYPGTGLGLSIVKRIAQHHGGRLTVSSVLGDGTVFTLTLPALPSL